MSSFLRLEDSPMFQKQICSLEHMADDMKNRCQILYKGSKKFLAALGEACIGDNSFADSLEAFGGWKDDSVSLTIEGPIMSRFINAFRELASYKEMLCSQVEHVLVDRLTNIMNIDFQDVKESRRRFDKAISAYDQAREKFVSLKKNTPEDIVAELEEDLQNSKSAFERSRFNLVNALMTIEAKKKYEFLESISAIMDSHLKYFKLGYELLKQLEPFIQQVYTYSQQAKESATAEQCNLEKRIQEFTQAEMDTVKKASSQVEASTCSGGICVTGLNPDKNIEAIMQSSINGEVQTIKQGYLLKRSSSLRGDWKRRFFVLDSQGTLYYYRNKGIKPMGFLGHYAGTTEHNSGVFSRFRVKKKGPSVEDMSSGCRTVDLRTSTIKMDAEDTDLRLCFRIISPMKTLTLQAEHGSDLMDWVNKITAVITSLLNSHIQQQHVESSDYVPHNNHGTSDDQTGTVSAALREIPGNDVCAECNAGEPDWASLNLGVLICIECSGVHRNLGVHISKVRSLTLDVKAWEPTIVELFCSLGNTYCNSIWEGSLLENERVDESKARNTPITKPCPKDSFLLKEKFIYAKYVYKMLMTRDPVQFKASPRTTDIWEAVESDNLRQVYRLIATASGTNIVNTTFDDVFDANLYYHIVDAKEPSIVSLNDQWIQNDPLACQRIWDSNDPGSCLQGCSLLHLACQCGNPVMVDLLLQFGADINMRDYHGRTPLHHCIALGKNTLAKHLLRRGASSSKRDGGGFSSLDRAMEKGAISDEGLLISLSESN